ncbi:undecaprenyldiphospho-muramoylpentapeptide beta-N-acetylglucosaminyltransferase [Acaricomes phytoseiuli]|uniref:undecaprenyldiphospho-muramoylpentapeptide beta-N-acetylglucosaminyltransferase n=1 Tax=Acaricomes phytoseiuli TaxID=291968 RepID=UPI000375A625|nr:undecaprenyldiphospho-muramoylpentapeptide beta-N-acetylglucosaminyltransferase [Acaricomes phytoseiuli]MCW1249551.1 undecaprenyldiphospho-muramoylpentapeptide beta-N-acetylglucosaminyltransferase [Acaricomes phytoseiuli]
MTDSRDVSGNVSGKTAQPQPPLSIVLAGGGTAGHVSPLLAIAAALRQAAPDARLLAVGTAEGLEARLVPEAGLELALIERVPMPRRFNRAALSFPARMRRARKQARGILTDAQADVVVGVGGYVCTPMYAAASRSSIPVVIHEANMKPGLANRLGARAARYIGTAFADTARAWGKRDAQWVGMPMRADIARLAELEPAQRQRAREEARGRLGLQQDLPVLVVTGGSLGAARINRAVADVAQAGDFASAGVQVLHLTGTGKAVTGPEGESLAAPGYHQQEYLSDMADAYVAADLLICRAGAGTVSEVATAGVPAVFVPLPIGNGEQRLNAQILSDRGGAVLIKDKDFSAAWIRQEVLPLLADPARLSEIGRIAAESGISDAAERMAELTLEAAR